MIKTIFYSNFLIWVLLLFSGCGTSTEKLPAGHEASSQSAPSGQSRAFVWVPELGELGATVSQPYQVWMQSLQGEKQETLVWEADKTDGVRVSWKAPDVLEVCYGQAQITYFRNHFISVGRNSPQIYKAEIVLKKVAKLDDC